eukprot:2492003-Pyramimonas_sp.AAC.1
MRCPVRAHLPQTPQCAELSGFTGAARLLGGLVGPSCVDCMNVRQQCIVPLGALSDYRRVYAGHVVQARYDDGVKHIQSVSKVKAHLVAERTWVD